ncbi:reverse transcriptase domain-containing protein [Trichonephila clavipes]|nr:reverse transcriptase domain-containing protein [Trichonephila clavipes]
MSEELVLSGVLILSKVIKKELIRRQNVKRKKRKVWVKPWVGRRTEYGASHTLLKELKNEDHTAYRNMLRITGEQFDELLEMVRGKLSKQGTTMRMAIPVTTKLEITLRYLATGDSFKSLEYLFRVPETTISSPVNDSKNTVLRSPPYFVVISLPIWVQFVVTSIIRSNVGKNML